MQNPQTQPSANNYYSKADFWDERYQAGGYFDWYAEFPELQYAFENQYGMTKQDSILMVGCGNSKVSQQMYEAGYKNIVNIDISPTVIQQMKVLSPGMEWLVMDATQMTFEDNKFDFVIDKGTMDALIAGRDISPAVKLLKQCMRVTKQEGQLIQITYGSPQGRKKVFETALPFNIFDYYFAYVNLNDLSTMINLMRNNLIGPNEEKIEKQEALQKSMKEFMMIKLLRARRSKDKQFVIWQNFAKTSTSEQTASQNSSKQQTAKQIESQKVQKKQQSKSEQNVDQKEDAKQPTQKNQNDNIKYQSKPQKQSYVYAYSIKRKFGYDFNPAEFNTSQILKSYQGSAKDLSHFEIKGSQNISQSIFQCKQYCTKKQISHGSVDYVELSGQFSNNTELIKIKIQQADSVRINILSKTNIDLKISFIDPNQVVESLKKLGIYLIDKMGLSFHPCPKTYSLFTVMRGRMKVKTVNELLNKFWYPTYSFSNVDIDHNQATVILSIPPVLPEHLVNVEEHIKVYFSTFKQLKVAVEQRRNGFITFPELNLLSTLNMVSLSHNSGKSLEVFMQDFSTGKNQHIAEENSKLFVVQNTRLDIPSKLLPFAILHLMALF